MQPPEAPDAFTLVVLPDTQLYSAWKHDTFHAQTRWVAENARAHRVAAVLHVGDVTNDNSEAQWRVASDAMARLDGAVPYLVVTGNHDLGEAGFTGTRDSGFERHFPASRVLAGGEGGALDGASAASAWRVVDTPAGPWLLVGLGFGPRPEVLARARAVIDARRAMPAVVATHAHLYSDGERYDRRVMPRQDWHPAIYPLPPGDDPADGEDIFRALVEPCSNVALVACGHVLHEGVARRADRRPDGTTAWQLLANYQHRGEGGDGYLRCVRVDPSRRAMEVRTYSPLLDRELDDDANRFTVAY